MAKQHLWGRMYAEQWPVSLPGVKARNCVTFAEPDPYKISYEEATYAFPSLKQFCSSAAAGATAGDDDGPRKGIYYVTAAAPGKVEYRADGLY